MADFVWPLSLPQVPRLGELERQLGRTVIRTEMDAGPASVRRRFTFAPERFPIALDMTAAQVATLVEFFNETTKGGSLPFDWKHPTLRSDVTLRFMDEPKFKPQSTFASTKATHLCTFQVETLPPAAIEPIIEPGTGPDYAGLAEHHYDDDALGADAGLLNSWTADVTSGVGPEGDIDHWEDDASIVPR